MVECHFCNNPCVLMITAFPEGDVTAMCAECAPPQLRAIADILDPDKVDDPADDDDQHESHQDDENRAGAPKPDDQPQSRPTAKKRANGRTSGASSARATATVDENADKTTDRSLVADNT